jgi:hypothetical protein
MDLEIEHIVPYLPFGLKFKTNDGIGKIIGIPNYMQSFDVIKLHFGSNLTKKRYDIGYENEPYHRPSNNAYYKLNGFNLTEINGSAEIDLNAHRAIPILRPLSDLDIYKVKDLFGESISDFRYEKIDDFSFEVYTKILGWTGLSYNEYTIFFRHHYDIFNLIENKLAININNI